MNTKKTIIFGIGNCGRSDDGLGWAFLDDIKEKLPENFDIEYRYQLQVEDAEIASKYDVVYFIDAHVKELENGFVWEKCIAEPGDSYTSHELNPEAVLSLTESIYNRKPLSYVLGITGEKYELSTEMSKKAKENLKNAIHFFSKDILFDYQSIDQKN